MKVLTKFYPIICFRVSKNKIKDFFLSSGYFNVGYSGSKRGFYADCFENRDFIYKPKNLKS